MKCEITTSWKGVDERMMLTRDKEPDEVWTPPGDDVRAVLQMVEVLDHTYGDVRAALLAMVPSEVADRARVVMIMTPEQAKEFAAWWDNR